MYYATDYRSPIGTLTLVCDETGVAGLWLEGQKYYFGGLPQRPLADGGSPVLSKAKAWLERYFAKDRPMASELPLAPAGGAFRQGVWELLCQIPYGQIVTYGELAARVAKRMQRPRMSAQAVGGAVGHNPVSILIPCHRVVGANGSLTGYAGGVEKKRWLLEHEGLDVSALPVPKRR